MFVPIRIQFISVQKITSQDLVLLLHDMSKNLTIASISVVYTNS